MRIYKALPSRLHARDKRVMSVLDTSDQYSSLPTRFLHGIVIFYFTKKIYFKYLIALDALKVDSFLHKHNLFLIGANLVCFLFIVHRKMVLSNNNIGNIPESEDGCSLLGSSRKSLADTSVTSTADLSVFSIGQRSQQYDICADDMQSVHSDGEGGGESSPG